MHTNLCAKTELEFHFVLFCFFFLQSLWFSSFVFWSVCILVHQPADATEQVSGRYARATMPMMLDMRGTPDLKGECSRAGFKRNNTDCTQFYR